MKRNTIDALFEHYKNQIYKLLGLFESNDPYGFKFGLKMLSEIEHLPSQFKELYGDYHFNIVLIKIDAIIDELYFLDEDNHQLVKNHVMEAMKLLDKVKEGLK